MRVCGLTLVFAAALAAADPQQLAVAIKAQTDYDRVELAPTPQLADTGNCIQSQVAALSVSVPEEMALLHFRKGYCELAGALITGNNRDFQIAAADFDRAIDEWPARIRKASKKQAPEPLSSGLRVL